MQPGQIGWIDLTVADAPPVRDFYVDVAGWDFEEHSMGGEGRFAVTEDPAGSVCALFQES